MVSNFFKKLSWLRFEIRLLLARIRGKAPSLSSYSIPSLAIRRLGSEYGGWWVVDNGALQGAFLISAGLGEDASFDVEFCNAFGAKVVLVDPTPRAIAHFESMAARFGRCSEAPYQAGGQQRPEAYDLRYVTDRRMRIFKKALWTNTESVRFYAPKNQQHVSYSIHNLSNSLDPEAPFLNVECITLDKLIYELGVEGIDVLKLDIEGAEIEVLEAMLRGDIFPSQLLVEFDELVYASRRSKKRIEEVHQKLLTAGYCLVHRERSNCTYFLVSSS